MAYNKITDFASKDSLPSGDTDKIVKGAEIDTEFNNIAAAINTVTNSINSIDTGVTGITYNAGSTYLTAGQQTTYTAPNPGLLIAWITPGTATTTTTQVRAVVNGASITMTNSSGNTAHSAFYASITHAS